MNTPADPLGAGRPRIEACPYLTIQDAAVRLRCSTKTVRRYIASGKLVALSGTPDNAADPPDGPGRDGRLGRRAER